MAGARIQLKRATASSWASNNPVLFAGEIGLETDTNKFKIGDGTTAYNSLAYFNGNLTGSSLNDLADVTIVSAANGDFLRWNGTAWVNDAVNLSTDTIGAYVESLVAGTGVTLSNNSGEGATPTVAIGQDVGTSASVTFAHVNADVTGDVLGDLTGNADTATTLETARTIQLIGDISGSASFDGSSNIQISAAVEPNSVALGQDTTGNYMQDVSGGTGVTVTHTPGEGSSATIAIGQDVGTSASVTFGQVTISGDLTVNGTTTTLNTQDLLVEDNTIVLNANVTGDPSGTAGIEIERGSLTNVQLRWNETTDSWEITEDGTTYRNIAAGQDVETSSSVTFAAVTAPLIGNASTATTLATARAISLGGDLSGSVSFNGSQDVTITAAVEPNSVALGQDTTGNYIASTDAVDGLHVRYIPFADVASYAGEYNNGASYASGDIVSTGVGSPYGTSGQLFIRVSNPGNPGYPPGTASWSTYSHQTSPSEGCLAVFAVDDTIMQVRVADVSNTEIGYLNGVTSAIQTQIDSKAPLDSPTFTGTVTLPDNTVALGSKTTGDYVSSLVAGTGITLSNNSGESATPTVAIGQDVATTASVTFAAVTAPLIGNANTATALQNARTIELSGDVSGSASFDGSSNVTITASVQPNSVALGTDTTGNYVSNVVAGTGISVTHTPGEGSSASVALNAGLNELSDVVIAGSPERFQTIGYDGAGWVNSYAPVVSYVRNAEATTLTVGTVVYLFGGTGDHASVKRASNASDLTSSKTVGIVGTAIAAGQNGPVITRGYASGMNLSAYSEGDILWLGTSGGFTTTKPSAPDHLVFVGVVVRATNNGIIYVATQNGYELEELHDVKVSSLTNGDFLKYVSASGVWVNDQINLGTDTVGNYVNDIVAGTGVTVTHTPGEGSSASIAIGQAVATSSSVVFARVETTGHLVVGQNLYVSGSVVTENQTSLQVDDPFIYLNGSASASGIDIGIAGNINEGSSTHSGVFRDATDGKWKFFDSYTPEPSSPINTGHASYSPAPVVAETFESTIATGSAPFVVASTTEVANLHADTATTLHTARAISLGGDLSGSASFDGSGDITITASVEPNSVALGTDTTGNYMVGLAEGTGVTIIHTPGEGSTASVSIGQSVATTASVTFAHVSAPLSGNVVGNVTGDVSGNAGTATTLQTSRTISLGGDLSGSASFNGGSDITITAAVQPNSVALGTDTTGNYMSDLTQGTGVTITHTPGEGSNATIAIGQDVGTSSSVTFAAVTAPLVGNASTATTLQNARAISLGGDLSGSASFDGSTDITITAAVQPNSVALGTDTTGNYVSDVTAGTGVTVTHTPGEGSSPTIAIGQAVGTSASVQFAQITTTGNVTIGGDLTVNGTTTTVNTETINLADNIIVLNSNETSAPSQNAGIEVERGSSANVSIRWNETSDKWEITEDGTAYEDIATVAYVDAQSIAALDDIGDVTLTSASAGDFLKWNGSAWVNDPINLGTDTAGNYVSDVVAGNLITVTHTPGEGSSASIAVTNGTAGQIIVANSSGVPTYRTLSGDITISSTGNVSINANAVALGTNTTGNYVANVSGGTGITVTHTPGEGSSASVALNATLDDLSNVTVPSPTNGQVLTYSTASSAWIAQNGASAINALDDIGDVAITSAASGDFLKWNGSAWVNDPINLGTDTTGNYMVNVSAGDGITVTHTQSEGSTATISARDTLVRFYMEVI